MRSLQVPLPERSYPIYIGSNLLSQPELFSRHIGGRQVAMVTNESIVKLPYLAQLEQSLQGFELTKIILPDGEAYKNWQTLQWIFNELLKARHERSTTLIALGGGVVGDMTGFAAACYQRGAPFIQLPTTLLAQVDSSVGGKTGINHPLGKNMIGAFYQPQAVIIDTSTLQTLPERELSAGLAEVIKYGLIADADFLAFLESHMDALLARDEQALAQAISRSCAIKAQIVAQDERESGIRAILNLGHTFGHAIETHQGYGTWLHGEAVAAGTMMALQMSHELDWIDQAARNRAGGLLLRAKLPIAPPADMTEGDFMRHMAVDKKVQNGRLRLVLLEKLGKAAISADFPAAALQAALAFDYQTLQAQL